MPPAFALPAQLFAAYAAKRPIAAGHWAVMADRYVIFPREWRKGMEYSEVCREGAAGRAAPGKTVAFCTLGCKVNQYETDAMEELFTAAGYVVKSFKEKADIYVVNTCTVTNIADRKSRQMLHRARKMNPEAVIAAVGCYAQAASAQLEADPDIDLIIGNNKKSAIVALVEGKLKDRVEVIDINHTSEYEPLHVSHVCEHTRAYIKIQDGCNQFCSYCIIPYTRGRVRSRKPEDIVSEVQRLVSGGYKEIVLTGIHISSYGLDFEKAEYNQSGGGDQLIALIETLGSIPGLLRIRLGSLEPRIITESFVRRLCRIPAVCPHFHLSLQSGCDATLARMNRKYTAAQYAQCCQLLRMYFDHPAITTDVIVGFPGETDAQFEECAAFLEQIGFAEMHVFKYSKRAGTRAAAMKDQVDESVKNERSARLLALNKSLKAAFIRQWSEKKVEVLLEEPVIIHGQTYMTGHTKEYIRVAVPGSHLAGNMVISGKLSLNFNEDCVICERID